MKTISCGGHRKQPICLYDFTTKVLAHDSLVFSTRHLLENKDHYIDENYFSESRIETESGKFEFQSSLALSRNYKQYAQLLDKEETARLDQATFNDVQGSNVKMMSQGLPKGNIKDDPMNQSQNFIE